MSYGLLQLKCINQFNDFVKKRTGPHFSDSLIPPFSLRPQMDPTTNQVVKGIIEANDCLDRNYIVPELQTTAPGSQASLCPFVEVSILRIKETSYRSISLDTMIDHCSQRAPQSPLPRCALVQSYLQLPYFHADEQ